MAESKVQNKKTVSNGNRKFLVAAACVVLTLAVLTAVSLAVRNPFYLSAAQREAENGNFSEAAEVIVKTNGKRSELLDKYIMLRLDINRCYPDLLTEFNSEAVEAWSETAAVLSENADLLGSEISAQVTAISDVLTLIKDGISGYGALKGDILSMMDVFREINRLHTKGDDGKNIGFTVAEEKAKIRMWEEQCEALEQYSLSVDHGENIFLLTYLIKEVQGECTDLEDAIDSVIESGYSETDKVRFSGEGRKTYPDIRSSNASVNLLEKENYEYHLYKGVCRALTENLGEFYIP